MYISEKSILHYIQMENVERVCERAPTIIYTMVAKWDNYMIKNFNHIYIYLNYHIILIIDLLLDLDVNSKIQMYIYNNNSYLDDDVRSLKVSFIVQPKDLGCD